MKAKIKPLKGKYYGTEIEVELDEPNWSGNNTTEFKIWFTASEPSERYLESYGFTKEQWDTNAIVYDGWEGTCHIKGLDLICDSHYESQVTFDLAKLIVDAINNTLSK